MKRTWKVIVVVLILALLAVVGITVFCGWSMGSHGADPAKYEMIAKGMTFTEVEEILGKPRWNRTLDDGTVLWTYGRPLKWCTVQIRFDEDGSVVSKEHDH